MDVAALRSSGDFTLGQDVEALLGHGRPDDGSLGWWKLDADQ